MNYSNLGKDLIKGIQIARKGNESLNLFCMDIESFYKIKHPRPSGGVSAERYCDGEQLFIFIICILLVE